MFVLWVDDHPESVTLERKLLRDMGIVDVGRPHECAGRTDILSDRDGVVDLVISDIKRDDKSPGGIALLEDIRQGSKRPPVILYVTSVDPEDGVPRGAFGLTNRVDDLLNLVMDVLRPARRGWWLAARTSVA